MNKRILAVLLTVIMLMGVLPLAVNAATCTHPSMKTTLVGATCYDAGYTLYSCPDCGENFKFTGDPALNHPNMETTVVEATCYDAGYTLYSCPDCGDSFKKTGDTALNHPNMETTVVEATC